MDMGLVVLRRMRACVAQLSTRRRSSLACVAVRMTGMCGSLRYMAPEVAMSKPYNQKSEIYSFSIVLWESRLARLARLARFRVVRSAPCALRRALSSRVMVGVCVRSGGVAAAV
jgi:serine/threonine protein kinase